MAEFTPAFLDEIRNRVLVSDVVGRHVKLKRKGREWSGLSPFNREKTPSFTVNDQKGFYHCFSSGKHGDQFRFLMEIEGLSFPEAVEKLAHEAGIPMPERKKRAPEAIDATEKTYAALEEACRFYERALSGPEGREASHYLASREIDDAIREKFRLGYSPASRHALRDHLAGLGFSVAIMINAGLLIHGEDIAVPYDRFRHRLMFPILGSKGRPIAFGARALQAEAQPKYLNSPETELFHKGATLYFGPDGLAKARAARQVFLVEGYMDVIALNRAGIAEAAAPLGTALTDRQLMMAWRISDEPKLCFDGDGAGVRAAYRSLETAMPLIESGKGLEWVLLPEGQDPDDLLRQQGAEGLKAALTETVSLTELVWQKGAADQALDKPEKRAAFEKNLYAEIAPIKDETLRRHIGARLKEMISAAFFAPRKRYREGGYQPAGRHSGARDRAWEQPSKPSAALARSPLARQMGSQANRAGEAREASILRTLVHHPPLLEAFGETLVHLEFLGSGHAKLLGTLLAISPQDADQGADFVIGIIERSDYASYLPKVLEHPLAASQWPSQAGAATEDARLFLEAEIVLHRRGAMLDRELRESAELLASEPGAEQLNRLTSLERERHLPGGTEVEIEGFGLASGRGKRSL